MFEEFKKFALGGNMVDMAVGIVIGAAFGTIVASLVEDIIMPPVGLLLGGVDFSAIFTVLKDGTPSALSIRCSSKSGWCGDHKLGSFINTLISFLIVSAAIFMVVKLINKAKSQQESESDPQLMLLAEIRDLLKKQ